MAGTLKPDPEFQRFNTAREKMGHHFRFKPASVLFNVIAMGAVPVGLTLMAYNYDGQVNFRRKFRQINPFSGENYVPRDKDL